MLFGAGIHVIMRARPTGSSMSTCAPLDAGGAKRGRCMINKNGTEFHETL